MFLFSFLSSKGVASLVDRNKLDVLLDERPPPASILSRFMLSELRNPLLFRTSDVSKLLASYAVPPPYQKVSESVVTKATSTSSLCKGADKVNKSIPAPESNVWKKSNEDLSCVLGGRNLPDSRTKLDVSSTTQGSSRLSELSGTADNLSDDAQDSKDKSVRAGRYRKLRAPGPPNRATCDAESMSDSEHDTVINARMSLVSSKRLSGSVNILVESAPGSSVLKHGAKSNKTLCRRRKPELYDFSVPSSNLKSQIPNYNHSLSLSLPNVDNLLTSDRIPSAAASSKYVKCNRIRRN